MDASTAESKTSSASSDSKSSDSSSDKSGESCGEDTCKSPAKCEDDRCVCPEGYEDVNDDGSECKDIDECKERMAECSRGAGCKNEPGGYKCVCDGPAYVADGDDCKCADGYERDDNGYCVGDDGKACRDGFECKNGACEGGICCAQSCGAPEECHVAEGAKCSDDGKTCIYPVAKDGAACDDAKACTRDGTCKDGKCQEGTEPTDCDDKNPCTDDSCEEPTGCHNQNNAASCDDANACTSGDACVGGQCKGTQVDCSAAADTCNAGACDPKTGECIKKPRTTSEACDDMDSCTTGDTCKDGACTGSNACGANATACTPGAAGELNMCTCAAEFVSFQGRCVPMSDECQTNNPCSPDAECTDPSNTEGDVMCACKPGYEGDGVECRIVDPCVTKPCGEGTCQNDGAGSYTCTCPEGMRAVGGTCGCDLSGVFGARASQTVSWKDIDQFVEDGVVDTFTYLLQRHTYDADGNLKMELLDCGGTSWDVCSVPFPPFLGAEAYGQYVPDAIWGTPSMPRTTVTVSLPESQPGAVFKTQQFAMLSGIKLDDPMGAWPPDRYSVAGSPDSRGTAVNGATWLDPDNDGVLGLTTYAVGPGGEKADGVFPDPPYDYGPNSVDCPRSNDGARSPYAYPPAIPNGSLAVQRIKRVFAAQRAVVAYDGKIDSCDLLSGTVTGPDNGKGHVDGRVFGCVRVSGNSEAACGSGAIDFLDQQPQDQTITLPQFKLKRLPANATCQDVLTANYD